MLTNLPAKRLIIYVDETDKRHGKPVYEAVLDVLSRAKIAGASVFRGIAGFGSDGVFHTSKILELSTTLPVKIEVVDAADRIDGVLPEIAGLVEKGLVEVSETQIVSCGSWKPMNKQ